MTEVCPMLRTVHKLVTALQFPRLRSDLNMAKWLGTEYFYMNVLSAGLPGVQCKLYSLPIFSFGSKRKMATISLRVISTGRRGTAQRLRAVP